MKEIYYPLVLIPQSILTICEEYPLVKLSDFKNETPATSTVNSVPTLPIFPHHQAIYCNRLLLLFWGVWLMGMSSFFVFGVVRLMSWLVILFLGAAYSCLFFLLLLKVKAYLRQLLRTYQNQYTQYTVQIEELRKQEDKESREQLEKPQSENKPERLDRLEALFQQRIKPIGKSDARVGVSEDRFFKILSQYFSPVGRVLQGPEFFVSAKEVYRRNSDRKKRKIRVTYAADFLLLHRSGLGFDLEIDEPYALINKTPTHCIDEPKERHRNQFFLEGGWVVVRFTERQVVEAPLSCCKVLAEVIYELVGDERVKNELKIVPELLPVRPWTKQESKALARRDYRLSYLNKVRTN